MKGYYWIGIGALIGFAAGSLFGSTFAIGGIGIGMAGGIAIYAGMC